MQVLLSAPWYLNYISYGIDWPNYYKIDPQDFNGSNAQQRLVIGGEVRIWIFKLAFNLIFTLISVSQIESNVKASMLDLKNLFSGHKVLLFWRQIGVCLLFENGSVIEKRIEVRYSKRELEYNFRR